MNKFFGIRKIVPPKITPQNIVPYENTPPFEYPPPWKLSPEKITPQKFAPEKIALYENFPPEKITSEEIPIPLINHTNERKSKIAKVFALKKAVQHNILIKITKVLFDAHMISQKILGLHTFFTEWKKAKNLTEAKIAKWDLLVSCTTQGELKLGSQTIKFDKYMKLLNSQSSLHITLWI